MTPTALKKIPAIMLPALADEVREKILRTVSKNGGHLASSLGAVEIAIALLRTFEPPQDKVLWDVGHQAYAWKILTGRDGAFDTLRKHGGLSPFPNPNESQYDAFIAGHAGSAFAAAEGLAVARDMRGGTENVVAVVGDASLSNGVSLEALNNCAALTGRFILVLNDNAMSISKNVGAFARQLGKLLTGIRYNRVKAAAENAGHKLKLTFLRSLYHRIEQTIKSLWLGNSLFESFGMRYIGPVDGHDITALMNAFEVAKADKRPVVVHVITMKGRGYAPAEIHPSKWHGVGPFAYPEVAAKESAAAKKSTAATHAISGSAAFGKALVDLARKDKRICAITAAMKDGTGLSEFAQTFPKRFFDVGICEEHAVTFAAGLAKGGFRPVVALYSSFLQRAIDQIIHDVALLKLPVVFAIDRAGVVGADGMTHHGLFDIPLLRSIPHLKIFQPTDCEDLASLLTEAFTYEGPTAIRFPRGPLPATISMHSNIQTFEHSNILLWALGDQVAKANRVAEILSARNITAIVRPIHSIKPLNVEPPPPKGARIITLENGILAGGFGSIVRESFPQAEVHAFGWPCNSFVPHGTITELEKDYGFDAESIAATLAQMA